MLNLGVPDDGMAVQLLPLVLVLNPAVQTWKRWRRRKEEVSGEGAEALGLEEARVYLCTLFCQGWP